MIDRLVLTLWILAVFGIAVAAARSVGSDFRNLQRQEYKTGD